MKSIKNKTEINYMKKFTLEDGLALTKFIYWIKSKLNKNFRVTELDAQKKLEKFRKLNKSYLFPSFNTIAGTGPNGAIIHYRATMKAVKLLIKKICFYATLEVNINMELQMLLGQFVFQNSLKK